MRRLPWLFATLLAIAFVRPALAQQDGIVTRQSAHAIRPTIDHFSQAVREINWVVFAEIDHAAAARVVDLKLPARTVVLFGNPRAGTTAMQGKPTLALDLPMRVLVWEDDQGRVFITRSTGADIATRVFARHGITVPPEGQQNTENLLDGLVRKATE